MMGHPSASHSFVKKNQKLASEGDSPCTRPDRPWIHGLPPDLLRLQVESERVRREAVKHTGFLFSLQLAILQTANQGAVPLPEDVESSLRSANLACSGKANQLLAMDMDIKQRCNDSPDFAPKVVLFGWAHADCPSRITAHEATLRSAATQGFELFIPGHDLSPSLMRGEWKPPEVLGKVKHKSKSVLLPTSNPVTRMDLVPSITCFRKMPRAHFSRLERSGYS